jgi:hypothetical protein
MEHALLVSWVYVYLRENISEFQIEFNCNDKLIADAYFAYKGKPYFLELHRVANKTPLTHKIRKYTDYAESEKWLDENWLGDSQFAKLIIVCDGNAEKIRSVVKKENKAGLRIQVLTLEELAENPNIIEDTVINISKLIKEVVQ